MHKHPNLEHKARLSFLNRIALYITSGVGTMWCAMIFGILAAVSAPAAFSSGSTLVIIAWITQTFLQLVLLPIILVGQNIQSKHAELQADLMFNAATQAELNTERILRELRDIPHHHMFKAILENQHALCTLLITGLDTGDNFEYIRRLTESDALEEVAQRAAVATLAASPSVAASHVTINRNGPVRNTRSSAHRKSRGNKKGVSSPRSQASSGQGRRRRKV